MKRRFFIFLVSMPFALMAQEANTNYSEKVQSLNSTIETLYAVISGEKGEERDWDLLRYLFHADAKLIPSGGNKDVGFGASYMTVEDYINEGGKWLVENGFFENEIHREVQTFGSLTHVFSTYESFHSASETDPFMRGINSIQLFNDGKRWWIINIYWTQETEENPIPEEYLPVDR